MSLTRKFVALVAPMLLLGGFSVLGAQGAAASSTTHKIHFAGSNGSPPAIETKAKVKFACNSTTGIYTVAIKNFSVIGADGSLLAAQFSGLPRHLSLVVGSTLVDIALTQNSATELFDAHPPAGVLSDPSNDCHTGTDISILSFHTGDHNIGYAESGTLP
jgi:hypothetical protein